MRLLLTTISSAVLLSGCSWFGGQTPKNTYGQQVNGGFGAPQFQNQQRNQLGRCQVFHAQQALPRGCHPSEVTIATTGNQYGGFPQQPNFGAGYGAGLATGGFGSHASAVRASTDYHVSDKAQKRKPRFRGQFSIGGEKNIVGDLVDANSPLLPAISYDPNDFLEGFSTGTPGEGLVTDVTFTSEIEEINQVSVSFEDAYSTPINVRGGFEFIANPKTTFFANAGYVYAEGEVSSTTVQAELQRIERNESFELITTADPLTDLVTTDGTTVSTGVSLDLQEIPNVDVARFEFEYSDLERIDLEAGARRYFDPILGGSVNSSITPFVGASAGAARYNAQTVSVEQQQLFLQEAFESNGEELEFFEVFGPDTAEGATAALFDSQWVPTGTVTAGFEWQATPKTALAFETGVRFEGGRNDVNGNRGDNNVSIPFTIRGSYNF